MRNVFTFSLAMILVGSAMAQMEVIEVPYYGAQAPSLTAAAEESAAINDTLFPFATGANCDFQLTNYVNANDQSIIGTFDLGANGVISDIAQVFVSFDPVAVEGLQVWIAGKEAGSNPGNITAYLYDDSLSASRSNATAMSTPISFANLDTANIINTFTFPSPVTITDSVFWGAVQVDNGSDTISLFASDAECGGGISPARFKIPAGWLSYSQSFTTGGNPLDISIFMFALVDTNTIGLSEKFISQEGLSSYPNPTNGATTIEFEMDMHRTYDLRVQDMTGRTVYTETKSFNSGVRKFEIDLSHLPKGPYTYQVVGEREQRNGVLVKR